MQRQTDANDGGMSRARVAVLDGDASAVREEAESGLSHAARSASLEAKRLLFDRGSWTLVDQCVVSLGNFALNVQLARNLAVADYGKFVLFLGAIFVLRTFDYSLISYPLAVRLHSARRDEHAGLMANSALLASALGLVLLLLLVLGIQLLGGSYILLPAASCYLAWQAQETMRRCLLANFRFRAAVAGDAVSFIGQAVAIAVLAWAGGLTLNTAIYSMSATFVAGALVHASKLHFGRPNVAQAIRLAREYFALGKWSLVYYEVLILRLQLFPWALAATASTAATAAFQAAANIANVMNSDQPRDRQRHSAGRGPRPCDWRRPRCLAHRARLHSLRPAANSRDLRRRLGGATASTPAHVRGVVSLSRRRARRSASRYCRGGRICRRHDRQDAARRRSRQARVADDRVRPRRSSAFPTLDRNNRRRRCGTRACYHQSHSPSHRLGSA